VDLPGKIFNILSQYLEARCNQIQKLSLQDITLYDMFFSIIPFSPNLRYLWANIGEDYDFKIEHFTLLTFLPFQHLTELYLHLNSSIHFPLLPKVLVGLAPNTLECFSLNTLAEFEDEWINCDNWCKVLSELARLTKFNLFVKKDLMFNQKK